jgi:hypothetical protein
MHDFLAMQVGDGLADVSEILFDLQFGQGTRLDFLKQRAIVSILQHHVRNLALLINLVVEELDDFGMGEFVMKDDLVFGKFVNLS